VVWGVFVIVNTAWPRRAVYNPTPPFHWALQWGAVLFCGIVLLAGLVYYRTVQRHKVGVLPQHAATADFPAPGVPAAETSAAEIASGPLAALEDGDSPHATTL
jgi:hypothetical protein